MDATRAGDVVLPGRPPGPLPKALSRADVVILDLEDAVGPENRPAAREALIANPIDPDRVVVRINPATTDDYHRDLTAVAKTDYRVVMQAKSETPESVIETALATIALVETRSGPPVSTRSPRSRTASD